jgi:hypothetical protein
LFPVVRATLNFIAHLLDTVSIIEFAFALTHSKPHSRESLCPAGAPATGFLLASEVRVLLPSMLPASEFGIASFS